MSIFYFLCGTYKKNGCWCQPNRFVEHVELTANKKSLKHLSISPINIIIDHTDLSGVIITDGVSSERVFEYKSKKLTLYGQDLESLHLALSAEIGWEYFCSIKLIHNEVCHPNICSKECKEITFDEVISIGRGMPLGDYHICTAKNRI